MRVNRQAVKWTLAVVAVAFGAIQAVRPAMTNPPVDETHTMAATAGMPQDVAAIFDRACADCHSNKTEWPWYSKVAPVSWYLAHHVDEGRRELNVSDWAAYEPKRKARKLQEICEQVEKGEMPITSYLLIHPSAKLSDADRKTLCDWSTQERERVAAAQTP